jgi:hypothetical protein
MLNLGNKRQTIRAEVNPMDKCTIFSIYPKDINEVKHTIQPGFFHIDKGSYEKPSRLVVGPSSWWRDIDFEQPLIEIPVSSMQIAKSVVNDYANGLIACNMADAMPGLFFVTGEVTVTELKDKYSEALETANRKQRTWFKALVEMADTLWAKSNGNPIVIAQDMRLAAEELGIMDKEWMANQRAADMIRCVACGSFRNPAFPICSTCHTVVDPELAKKLKLQLA